MEPFGIFQFLQSLLAKPEENNASQSETLEQKNLDEPVEKTEKVESEPSPAQDAFLVFLSSHDRRAKNVKKP